MWDGTHHPGNRIVALTLLSSLLKWGYVTFERRNIIIFLLQIKHPLLQVNTLSGFSTTTTTALPALVWPVAYAG